MKFCYRTILAITALTAIMIPQVRNASAQGYYYPPQRGYYYPPYSQPQQRRQPYPQQQRRSKPAQKKLDKHSEQNTRSAKNAKKETSHSSGRKDISGNSPPDVDISSISEPFISYTWDFQDKLSDLAKASGISNSQLLALNDLSVSQLQAGQALKLPKTTATKPAEKLDVSFDPVAQRSRQVWRGVRGKKRVALTFDAGGEPDGLDTLLGYLTSRKAAATFFATGEFARKHPTLIKHIADAGYNVHNHSWSHPKFTTLDDDQIEDQLSRANDEISSVAGRSTKPFWRPPFGDTNKRILRAAAENGYQSIYWTLDSLDSVGDKKDADFVTNRVLHPPRSKKNPDHFLDGAIILMHVGEPKTAEAVPRIVDGLRKRGFTLVTVEEILKP